MAEYQSVMEKARRRIRAPSRWRNQRRNRATRAASGCSAARDQDCLQRIPLIDVSDRMSPSSSTVRDRRNLVSGLQQRVDVRRVRALLRPAEVSWCITMTARASRSIRRSRRWTRGCWHQDGRPSLDVLRRAEDAGLDAEPLDHRLTMGDSRPRLSLDAIHASTLYPTQGDRAHVFVSGGHRVAPRVPVCESVDFRSRLRPRYPPSACCRLKGRSSERPLLLMGASVRTTVYLNGVSFTAS